MKDKNRVIVGDNSGIAKATAEMLREAGINLHLYSKSGNNTTALDTRIDFSEVPGLPEVGRCFFVSKSLLDDGSNPPYRWRIVQFEVIFQTIYFVALSYHRVQSREESAVIMKTPPESFLLFKEELRKVQLEKERLKQHYEEKLSDVNRELCRLKEQIQSHKI